MYVGRSSTYYSLLSNNIGSLLGTSSSSATSSLTDLLSSAASGASGKPSAASKQDSQTVAQVGDLKSGAAKLSDSISTLRRGDFKDTDDALKKLQKFADSYNSLFDTAKGIAGDDGNSKLATQMVNNSKTYAGSLEKLGISFDKEGKMAVDTKKATEAAESGAIESYFSANKGQSYGFANQLNKIASNVSRNPTSYANKATATSNVGYSSQGMTLSNLFASSGSLLNLLL